jgi:hypothetical protein
MERHNPCPERKQSSLIEQQTKTFYKEKLKEFETTSQHYRSYIKDFYMYKKKLE